MLTNTVMILVVLVFFSQIQYSVVEFCVEWGTCNSLEKERHWHHLSISNITLLHPNTSEHSAIFLTYVF